MWACVEIREERERKEYKAPAWSEYACGTCLYLVSARVAFSHLDNNLPPTSTFLICACFTYTCLQSVTAKAKLQVMANNGDTRAAQMLREFEGKD